MLNIKELNPCRVPLLFARNVRQLKMAAAFVIKTNNKEEADRCQHLYFELHTKKIGV